MKLSEAIKLGAAMHAQTCLGGYFEYKDGVLVGTCALGAAVNALGATDRGVVATIYEQTGTDVMMTHIAHPIDGHVDDMYQIITELNDERGWTREQIAAWLDSKGY